MSAIDPGMTEPAEEARPLTGDVPTRPAPKTELSTGSDGTVATVDSAIDLSSERSAHAEEAKARCGPAKTLAARPRPASSSGHDANDNLHPPATVLGSPLRLQTPASQDGRLPPREGDSIAKSPILSKHTLAQAEDKGDSLPPFEPTSPATSSPQVERLPSFRQLAGSLTDLAEAATAATQEIHRQQQNPYAHHHSNSFGSITSQSPIMSNHPYPAAMQASPQAYYPPSLSARSPTSTIAETAPYGSSQAPQYSAYGFFPHRRPSNVADGPPSLPPSLPSASSSGESHGYGASPGVEGFSTAQTTPIDSTQMSEGMVRAPMVPMLPIATGMHPPPIMIPGLYKCDMPGCVAGTFQTQYLLK